MAISIFHRTSLSLALARSRSLARSPLARPWLARSLARPLACSLTRSLAHSSPARSLAPSLASPSPLARLSLHRSLAPRSPVAGPLARTRRNVGDERTIQRPLTSPNGRLSSKVNAATPPSAESREQRPQDSVATGAGPMPWIGGTSTPDCVVTASTSVHEIRKHDRWQGGQQTKQQCIVGTPICPKFQDAEYIPQLGASVCESTPQLTSALSDLLRRT